MSGKGVRRIKTVYEETRNVKKAKENEIRYYYDALKLTFLFLKHMIKHIIDVLNCHLLLVLKHHRLDICGYFNLELEVNFLV